jgi:tetratricopeptide (TPR) repeat protein
VVRAASGLPRELPAVLVFQKGCFVIRLSRSTVHAPVLVAACALLAAGCSGSSLPEDAAGRAEATRVAWREVGFLNFAQARPVFRTARQTATPGSAEWLDATLGLAVCLHHGQPDVPYEKQRAAELYEEILAVEGEPREKPLALLYRARLADEIDYHRDEPDLEQAEALYRRLMESYPKHPLAQEAALHVAQLRIYKTEKADARAAATEFRTWVEAHPGNPLESIQWLALAGAHNSVFNDPAAALEACKQAEAAGLPRMMRRDQFLWTTATFAERAGDRATARRYFARIIEEEPRSSYGYEAQLRIRKLGGDPPPLSDPYADTTTAPKGARS